MGFKFIDKAMEKGYDKFNLLAKEYLAVLNTGRSLREDLKVFILTHSEEIYKDFEVVRKMKTLGKMLDQAITLEGLFTVLLYTHSTWDEKEAKAHYYFVTNKTSEYPSKSPIGMFDDIYIPNDLGYVADKIDEFNN
jgi:Cys-tRNA synthase (O-phospho-L-seryl-tRNA:Cys-tRNA synthase)